MISFLLLSACNMDQVDLKQKDVEGYWNIGNAKRNGKETSLLDGGYFYFMINNRMATNIKGDTIVASYALEGDKIKVNAEEPMVFHVNYVTSDTIYLTSKIGSSNFEFTGIRPAQK